MPLEAPAPLSPAPANSEGSVSGRSAIVGRETGMPAAARLRWRSGTSSPSASRITMSREGAARPLSRKLRCLCEMSASLARSNWLMRRRARHSRIEVADGVHVCGHGQNLEFGRGLNLSEEAPPQPVTSQGSLPLIRVAHGPAIPADGAKAPGWTNPTEGGGCHVSRAHRNSSANRSLCGTSCSAPAALLLMAGGAPLLSPMRASCRSPCSSWRRTGAGTVGAGARCHRLPQPGCSGLVLVDIAGINLLWCAATASACSPRGTMRRTRLALPSSLRTRLGRRRVWCPAVSGAPRRRRNHLTAYPCRLRSFALISGKSRHANFLWAGFLSR